MIMAFWSHWSFVDHPSSEWPWRNFRPSEMAMTMPPENIKGPVFVFRPVMDRLQAFRNEFAAPFYITSAARFVDYNKTIRGAVENSLHLQAAAFDIKRTENIRDRHGLFIKLARKHGFDEVIVYENHIHIAAEELLSYIEGLATS